MANIIVLGGSGFIGKSLIQKLERNNFKNVKVMVNSTKIKSNLEKFQGNILEKRSNTYLSLIYARIIFSYKI